MKTHQLKSPTNDQSDQKQEAMSPPITTEAKLITELIRASALPASSKLLLSITGANGLRFSEALGVFW